MPTKAELEERVAELEALVAGGVDTPDASFDWHAGQGPRTRIVRALDMLRVTVNENLDEVARFLKSKDGAPWPGIDAFRKAQKRFERDVNQIMHPTRDTDG